MQPLRTTRLAVVALAITAPLLLLAGCGGEGPTVASSSPLIVTTTVAVVAE